jgi:hypothetical protein
VWAEAPAKPYHTVTFNKNDGTGAFEKRIATPETPSEGTSEEYEGGEIPAVEYKNFKIRESYKAGAGEVSQNPIIPVFTRDHYQDAAVWNDINDKPVTVTTETTYEGDMQLYHQWTAKTFTVKFDLNGKSLSGSASKPGDISGINEALSAEGGLAKADQKLPALADAEEGEGDSKVTYTFRGWAADPYGGKTIGANTPLYPEKGATEVTLYAKWGVEGVNPVVIDYTGQVREWTVPAAGIYKIEAWGASSNGGGLGGYIGGNVALNKNDKLHIYVGGQGRASDGNGDVNVWPGGWNGGGSSGASKYSHGGSGGGASDVRAAGGAWDNSDSLNSRIIVAGGGGGNGVGPAVANKAGNGGYGMAAGGSGRGGKATDTEVQYPTAGGGELGQGGVANPSYEGTSGALGIGGNGVSNINDKGRGGGGGGGGYYGGAGGGQPGYYDDSSPENRWSTSLTSGGGGGSSWAGTVSAGEGSLYIIPETLLPKDSVVGGGNNTGKGKVAITFVGTAE